jgi:hypothetical protein
MPDAKRPAALDSFIAELRQAWLKAGPPTYDGFQRLSARVGGPGGLTPLRAGVLHRSTTQQILMGHRCQPPKWPWVVRYWSVLQIAATENGRNPDSLGPVEALREAYEAAWASVRPPQSVGVADGERLPPGGGAPRHRPTPVAREEDAEHDSVLASIRRAVGVEWWREYRDVVPEWFGPCLSLEAGARLIHSYDPAVIPGLLQTPAYAIAAICIDPHQLPEAVARRLVELRLRRQQIIDRPDPPRLWGLIDEVALRRQFVNPAVMRDQIRHLISLSERPNVTIQVLPLRAKIRTAASGPMTLLRFRRSDAPDVVYAEQLTSALYLHDPRDISYYKKVLTAVGMAALKPPATADFLRQVLREV